jgi:hypothetical protein
MNNESNSADSGNSYFEAAQLKVKDDFLPEPDLSMYDRKDKDSYVNSIADLAGFLDCSYNSALRLKQSGAIKFSGNGHSIRFYIPDIFEAIENDDKVGRYIDRMMEKIAPDLTDPTKKDIKIFTESELIPGRFMFIDIKYQRWRGTAVCSPDLWDQQTKIRSLVQEIIAYQHIRKPFKTKPFC